MQFYYVGCVHVKYIFNPIRLQVKLYNPKFPHRLRNIYTAAFTLMGL